ncbi:MAG: hypothetical protein KBT46_02830, partial [Ruminococcus sp.]|nr:hypothetical protein [Candidatus Copronaster equi]
MENKDFENRTIMICPKCYAKISGDTYFCPVCQSPLDTPVSPSAQKSNNNGAKIAITCIICVTVLLGIVLFLVFNNIKNNQIDNTPFEISAQASSYLNSQKGNNYYASNTLDKNLSTCWAEGASGNGYGEKLILNFSKSIRLNKIIVRNGYCKNETLFYENNRVKTLKITFDNGKSVIANLKDGYVNYEATIEFDKIVTSCITLEIVDVFSG